ncbi:mRNA interferase RelE/StbE [Branchiibius hedensis]|uniref:mRNA interferase RelE/StbE n=1 Tax=Branchiibius hedensis TaxID=672460 RepID=A0A2Y8ZSV4_9MICO|nr:type II toxin-antitoxin system RelE/ParE family toxin [Branchiibius hedensis]PWJ26242.1 mRNA interferase RelE/StbE [Branchiibius hedensis]SSA35054.1 mRNA interferase RelE/StbE [Branchiibius hedensis]
MREPPEADQVHRHRATYRVEVRPAALRQLRKIDPTQQARIRGAIALLAEDPRPPAAKPLRGRPAWRVRVGDYRIIYTINDDVLLIVIVTLGHSREVYR